jgi:hypothetical protein
MWQIAEAHLRFASQRSPPADRRHGVELTIYLAASSSKVIFGSLTAPFNFLLEVIPFKLDGSTIMNGSGISWLHPQKITLVLKPCAYGFQALGNGQMCL